MPGIVSLSVAGLDAYLGLSIDKICPLGFGSKGDEHNHCAHFVGHALRINAAMAFGLTCNGMVYRARGRGDEGACLRVNDVFNNCMDLEEPEDTGCLAYTTVKSNMRKDGAIYLMGSMSRKHIGIYFQGNVWHYGNTRDAVKRQPIAEFRNHYSGSTVTRFTAFPDGAIFQPAPGSAAMAGTLESI